MSMTPDEYWQGLADLLQEAMDSDDPPKPSEASAPLLWLAAVMAVEIDMDKPTFLNMVGNVYDEAFVASAAEDDLSARLRLIPKGEPN
jgi:hypothetical protein